MRYLLPITVLGLFSEKCDSMEIKKSDSNTSSTKLDTSTSTPLDCDTRKHSTESRKKKDNITKNNDTQITGETIISKSSKTNTSK